VCKHRLFLVVLMASHLSAAGTSYRLDSGEVIQDPTKPAGEVIRVPSSKQKEIVNYELNYIINSSQRKLAVINGRKVSEGGRVSGALVKRIGTNEVEVIVSGQRKVLRVNQAKNFKSLN